MNKANRFTRPIYAAVLMAAASTVTAEAARCSADANGNWSCSYQQRYHGYWCSGAYVLRAVRWQVPEGQPPTGGWPVAFYYAGTQFTDTRHAFERRMDEPHGLGYEPRIIHELLDDPVNTGRKYAVMVPDPPSSAIVLQAWHTNIVYPYSASCDAQFFPDFFAEIRNGSYGPASQYNMRRRYAYGISSGGFNTSRMAVTFNSDDGNANSWKALGIMAASYATCSYRCSVPELPVNHPPTKFWHGINDPLAPIKNMRMYFDKLVQGGFIAQKLEHGGGHTFTSDMIGPTGVKRWFDQF